MSDWSSDVCSSDLVILNGGEKAELVLENKARILRERDIMTEEQANSPAKRIYFVVQMRYMFPDNERYYQQKFNELVRDFVNAVRSEERRVGKECVSACSTRWSADNSKKQKKKKN